MWISSRQNVADVAQSQFEHNPFSGQLTIQTYSPPDKTKQFKTGELLSSLNDNCD